MCGPMVYGKYICHNSKFLLKVREYVSKSQKWPDHTDVQCQSGQTAIRQGYILTNLINMSVKLFSTVSIVFFPVDFKSARYHSRFCIFN